MRAGGGAAAAAVAAGLLGAAAAAAAKLALGPGGEAAGGWVRKEEMGAGQRLPGVGAPAACPQRRPSAVRASCLSRLSGGRSALVLPLAAAGGAPPLAPGGVCWESGAAWGSRGPTRLLREPGLVAAGGATGALW